MSTRFLRPTRAGAAAAALATGLVGLLAGPAAATPTSPAADADHSEAVQLSWDGSSYAASTTESFLGTPAPVPADTPTRTRLVPKAGPTAARPPPRTLNSQPPPPTPP